MSTFPSGLHRYAGDPMQLKLRFVFTHPVLLTDSKFSSSKCQAKDGINNTHYTAKLPQDPQNQTSFLLLRKHSNGNNRWTISEEIESVETAPEARGAVTSSMPARTGATNGNNLASMLRQKGFALRVMNAPSKGSRMMCHVCPQDKPKSTIEDGLGNHLSRDANQTESTQIVSNRAIKGNLETLSQRVVEVKMDELQEFHFYNSNRSRHFLFERQRASFWKDTTDMNSGIDCDDIWKRTQARKLLTHCDIRERCHDQLINSQDTIARLTRNHYLPLYEPYQCSHIHTGYRDKNYNDFCLPWLICARAYAADNVSAKDNQETNNNQLGDITLTKNCNNDCYSCNRNRDILYSCHCRCGELNESYKRYLNLSGTLINSSDNGQQNFVRPSMQEHSDNLIVTKKLTEFLNSDKFEFETTSCLDGCPNDLESSQETQSSIDTVDDGEIDSFREATEAQVGNSQITEGSKSSDDKAQNMPSQYANLYDRKRLEPTKDRESQHRLAKCCCSEEHGETLIVVMEKYSQCLVEEEPLVIVSAVNDDKDHEAILETLANPSNSLDKLNAKEEKEKVIDKTIESNISMTLPENIERKGERQNEGLSADLKYNSSEVILPDLGNSLITMNESSSNAVVNAISARVHSTSREPDIPDSVNYVPNPAPFFISGNRDNNFNSNHQSLDNAHEKSRQMESQTDAQESSDVRLGDDCLIVQSQNAKREYSTLLAVIVIDMFNRTIHMKPDLNELILVDFSSADNFGSTRVNSALHSQLNVSCDIEKQQSGLNSMFYHIESVREDDKLEACENELNKLRNHFALNRRSHETETQRENSEESAVPTNCFANRSSPRQMINFSHRKRKIILLNLQLDIHCARGFSKDCESLFIRHKVYCSNHNRYLVKKNCNAELRYKLQKKDLTKADNRHFRSRALIHKLQDDDNEEDKVKLEQMTHLKRVILDLSREFADTIDEATSAVSKKQSIKGFNKTTETDSKTAEILHDDSLYDLAADNHKLIHEGSTVTSKANLSGHFNFCCAEQISLEISERRTQEDCDSRKFSFHDRECNGTKVSTTRIDERKKMLSMINEQKSSESSDEKRSQLRGHLSDFSANQDMLASKPADCLQNDSVTVVTMKNDPSTRLKGEQVLANDKINNNDSIQVDVCRTGRCRSRGCECKSRADLCGDQDDICGLLLVFEVYSSDFYSDKLKGWSFMNLPVSLDTTLIPKVTNQCRLSSQMPLCKLTSFNKQNQNQPNKCEYVRPSCHVLPVMGSVLGAAVDRLRYHLLGELPERTPKIESVSNG